MFKQIGKLLCTVLLMSILIGCSGSRSTSNNLPTEQPTPKVLEITLADNGRTIELCRNEAIQLKLGEGYDWAITIPNQAVISRDINIAVVRGAQGLYIAHKLGQTSLEAVGDPTCRQSEPPCETPSLSFRVRINVIVSPGLIGPY